MEEIATLTGFVLAIFGGGKTDDTTIKEGASVVSTDFQEHLWVYLLTYIHEQSVGNSWRLYVVRLPAISPNWVSHGRALVKQGGKLVTYAGNRKATQEMIQSLFSQPMSLHVCASARRTDAQCYWSLLVVFSESGR